MQWSSYDASVPHTSGLAEARAQLAELRRRRGPADVDALADVRELVVVASSSRGGSSLLGTLLRRVPGLLHLRAEINPLFVAAGLHEDDGDGMARAVIAEELAMDIGRAADDATSDHRFAADVAWRLVAQWPEERFDLDEMASWVEAAGPPAADAERVGFHLRFLALARERHPAVDPWYYDVPTAEVAAAFPDVPRPLGPPGPVVEMPPFVAIGGWRRATARERAERPVVLTTPRNAWRLPFLRDLFPNARLRVLHLVRNPAASINGLVDGWLHHGFFNCDAGVPLDIAGYSDRHPEWGRRWWNYDFPPEWETVTSAPLERVAALQWSSAHEAAMAFIEETGVDVHRMRFEDVVGDAGTRRRVLSDLGEWLGAGGVAEAARLELPPVMATAPPAPHRWRAREALLEPVLRDLHIRAVTDALGYDVDRVSWA